MVLTWRGAGVAHHARAVGAGHLGQALRALVLALAAAPARAVRLVRQRRRYALGICRRQGAVSLQQLQTLLTGLPA